MKSPISSSVMLDEIIQELSAFQAQSLLSPLDASTRFFADLGLASIDAVVLGERLEARFGQALPFEELMAELGQREDRDLSLGELAAFLSRRVHA